MAAAPSAPQRQTPEPTPVPKRALEAAVPAPGTAAAGEVPKGSALKKQRRIMPTAVVAVREATPGTWSLHLLTNCLFIACLLCIMRGLQCLKRVRASMRKRMHCRQGGGWRPSDCSAAALGASSPERIKAPGATQAGGSAADPPLPAAAHRQRCPQLAAAPRARQHLRPALLSRRRRRSHATAGARHAPTNSAHLESPSIQLQCIQLPVNLINGTQALGPPVEDVQGHLKIWHVCPFRCR